MTTKQWTLTLAAALLAGCQDAPPITGPGHDAVPALTAEAVALAQVALDDALTRILPALPAASQSAGLRQALEDLRGGLGSARSAARPGLVNAALRQVERAPTGPADSDPDLAALRLAVLAAQ